MAIYQPAQCGTPEQGRVFLKSLRRTEIKPKHSEGVVWAQNKGHF